jgi:hypothetical protein
MAAATVKAAANVILNLVLRVRPHDTVILESSDLTPADDPLAHAALQGGCQDIHFLHRRAFGLAAAVGHRRADAVPGHGGGACDGVAGTARRQR